MHIAHAKMDAVKNTKKNSSKYQIHIHSIYKGIYREDHQIMDNDRVLAQIWSPGFRKIGFIQTDQRFPEHLT